MKMPIVRTRGAPGERAVTPLLSAIAHLLIFRIGRTIH
jgi:hypothetical protein